MRRLALGLALAASLVVPAATPVALAQTPVPVVNGVDCTKPPLGALPPARPLWCDLPLAESPLATLRQGANAWVDDFEHGLSLTGMQGAGYKLFQNESLTQTADNAGRKVHPSLHFRHANHWMADVHHATEPGGDRNGYGGAYLRPDRTFRFQDGKLVVEFDYAAGVLEYSGNNWGELIVTTGAAPDNKTHGFTLTDTHGFSNFRGHWTFGTLLKPSRDFNDSFIINDNTDPATLKRPDYERHIYERVGGGGPWVPGGEAFRTCSGTDPDTNCRDRFRIEFDAGADTITWYVNGVRYHQAQVDRGLPAGLTDAPLYVYFVSWVYRNDSGPNVTRFHWDSIRVNPHLLGVGPVPPTPTSVPMPPTPTTTHVPATPTHTPTPVPPCDFRVRRGSVEGPYEPVPSDLRARFNCP